MKYAISAGHKEVAKTAIEIYENGGNAIDAAIAAFAVTMVVEPCMSSPGGGGFSLIRKRNKPVKAFDFFCQTPIHKISRNQEMFSEIIVDFGTTTESFFTGAGSMATPGSIAGIYAMHRYGGTIPMRELLSRAISLSKNGVPIDAFQALDITLLQQILSSQQRGKQLFYNGEKIKQKDDILVFPGLGDFFEVLAIEGERFFYQGEIAKEVEYLSQSQGGHLAREDFINYQVNVSHPLSYNHGDFSLYTMPFPSKGGPIIIALSHLLNQEKKIEPFSSNYVEHLQHAIKKSKELLANEEDWLTFVKRELNMSIPYPGVSGKGGTTHFSTLDKEMNYVSLTTSIGEGSGIWVPGSDIHMNNMLGEEALMDNGFYNWPLNRRLNSMMAPTIATKGNKTLITGSAGAGRIPYAVAQLIYYSTGLGMDLELAMNAPRLMLQDEIWEAEPGLVNSNGDLNVWEEQSLFFGGANSILIEDGNIQAIGDPRRLATAFIL